jgi:hypothetical protein
VLNHEDDVDMSGEQPARRAAYADLVTAVLDLRSPIATTTFDRALADAVAAGTLAAELARELRWLQRESVRDVVTHAANVLPAALVALDTSGRPEDLREHSVAERSTAAPGAEGGAADISTPDLADDQSSTPDEESAPVDLTARRLLVAGLRPILDSPFP